MFRARKESEMVLNSRPGRGSKRLPPPAGGIPLDQAARRGRLRWSVAIRVLLAGMALAGVAAQPVRAAAVVGLSEGGLHFGDQKVGTTSDPLVIVVSNHGPGTL